MRQLLAASLLFVTAGAVSAAEVPDVRGQFRWASTAIKFDVSPPLRDMPIKPPPDADRDWFGELMVETGPDKGWHFTPNDDRDGTVQAWSGPPLLIPAPTQSFAAGTGTANPPDPVGDVGPNHYVRMANASFQVFNKTGVSQFGPAAINTLFTGFGGDCETENAGDPIVVYDQFADRWLLSQFSNSTGPGFFNCVALSTTSDPTGSYFRWAFPASVFPDYPKYGVWSNAYVITTRELDANAIGVYAIDRQQMIAGNPAPVVISFLNPLNPGVAQFVGDGLLPADIDGSTLPPANSPIYLIGSMDDGGPYGADDDALSLWRMVANFANPPSSSITLASVIPIAPYDTIFPCVGRSCIAQPNGLAVDILSYRQRPTNRAAYRNFGSYESIVTTQSVEAAPGIAGMRWWEIRNPGGANPQLYQDATYAPGVTDTVQRWMGSIAQDRNANMALGYSVTNATNVFPGVRYTGRLERDPLGTMPQGEGEFVAGGGSFTASTRRWGDYTSMNVDSSDDCTFWYVNEYFATTGTTWTLRVGSFKFPECGQPDFGIAAVPLRQQVCAPNPATFTLESHAYSGFVGGATLAVSGNPAGTTATFLPASIATVPGTSVLTIGNTGAAAAGSYPLTLSGNSGAPGGIRSRSVQLDLFTAVPGAPAPTGPADDAVGTSRAPLLTWTAGTQGVTYVAEVATDAAFTNIVYTSPSSTALSAQIPAALLGFDIEYFWRVRSTNTCGAGANSAVFSFRTRAAPGVCTVPGQSLVQVFTDNMENGINGWTTPAGTGPLWAQSTARPFSGLRSWLAQDVTTTSDQRLVSPAIAIPGSLNSVTLRFQHDVEMEVDPPNNCFDGGYVEVSTNGGASFTPLPAGDVLQDTYTGPIPSGQQAWCGDFRYRTASIDLSPYVGQTIQLRFRAETDSSVGSLPDGWYVDDVKVEGCGVSNLLLRDGFE
jgi:hypothetical protein